MSTDGIVPFCLRDRPAPHRYRQNTHNLRRRVNQPCGGVSVVHRDGDRAIIQLQNQGIAGAQDEAAPAGHRPTHAQPAELCCRDGHGSGGANAVYADFAPDEGNAGFDPNALLSRG